MSAPANVAVDLDFARRVIRAEGETVTRIAESVDEHFEQAARLVHDCRGAVVVSGIGKAGIIGQKISATLASTGTPSHFLHPAEAIHGDLGRVQERDVVVVLSYGGATDEITRLLDLLKRIGPKVIAITGAAESILSKCADVVLCFGQIVEADEHNLAPSVSTACMLALGDALALTVAKMRRFAPEDFARFHPGGSLGRKMLRVEEAMTFRRGENLPVAADRLTVREVLHAVSQIKRRSGAVLLVGDDGRLTGIFSDSDLRRLLEKRENALDLPVAEVMTRGPKRIRQGDLASEAMHLLNEYRIDELPVVDENNVPMGLIDVQDLVVMNMV
jgi:arabinose-5-phosphate isomerase